MELEAAGRMPALPGALEGRRVLFISYNGMLDPLGQSQVIPYLRELSKRGLRFTLLSFERGGAFGPDGPDRCAALREQLAADGIEWHWLRYHQTPSLPATIYDVANGVRQARRLVRRNQIELVHARSHIPATIALALKRRFGLKIIFDVRGLMADEYVDAGHWRKGSVPYRLTKMMERRALAGADGIVTLTEKIWPIISQWEGLRNREVVHEVVPCCADLELFNFSDEDRKRRRSELGLGDRFVVVYSGSIDGWYLTDQMADFFAELLKRRPDAHFLWLTPTRHKRIKGLMEERHILKSNYTVLAAASHDVPSYLSAGDAGLAFIKPCFSKLASSPTKYAEYLACGLPLIINAGIGDSDALIEQERVGALVSDFNEKEFAKALITIESFSLEADETRHRTRAVAQRLFDVRTVGGECYARLYEKVLNTAN
jgi:glycosyltransferase involved in cell wall biosynthesis